MRTYIKLYLILNKTMLQVFQEFGKLFHKSFLCTSNDPKTLLSLYDSVYHICLLLVWAPLLKLLSGTLDKHLNFFSTFHSFCVVPKTTQKVTDYFFNVM